MKLEIRDRSGWTADRLSIHSTDETDEPFSPGKYREDFLSLIIQFRASE
jgi:hypothetical protein